MSSVFVHRWVRAACATLAAAVLVVACAKPPVIEPPPPPVSVVVEVTAAGDVNPDVEGRASPVTVRVYELADDASFASAELLALWDHEPETLAAAAVKRHEIPLAPGARSELGFKLDPRVRSIGVAAAYRDFRNASWKASVALPEQPAPGSTIRLMVSVGSGAVAAHWQ